MGQVLKSSKLINGVDPKLAKKICVACHGRGQSVQDIASMLFASEPIVASWLIALAEAGFLEICESDRRIMWLCSPKGYTSLVTARFGKALSGTQFSELLLGVAERAKKYNQNETYPFYIDKVYAFGTVFSQPWIAEDPNVAIAISERPAVKREKQWRLNYWRKRESDRNLRIVDQLFFPENELHHLLKKPKEHLHVYLQEVSEISDERRLLYVREGVAILGDESVMSGSEVNALGAKIEQYQKMSASSNQRRKRRLSNEEIVGYWKESGEFLSLDVPLDEAADSCWRCGSQLDVQQCHIVPNALGGLYIASNMVLLCGRCHAEGPNLADDKIMFDWIKAYRSKYKGDFWTNAAIDEYGHIFGENLKDEVKNLLQKEKLAIDVEEAMAELCLIANAKACSATTHFGQSWLNNATRAGCFRLALKELPSVLVELRQEMRD